MVAERRPGWFAQQDVDAARRAAPGSGDETGMLSNECGQRLFAGFAVFDVAIQDDAVGRTRDDADDELEADRHVRWEVWRVGEQLADVLAVTGGLQVAVTQQWTLLQLAGLVVGPHRRRQHIEPGVDSSVSGSEQHFEMCPGAVVAVHRRVPQSSSENSDSTFTAATGGHIRRCTAWVGSSPSWRPCRARCGRRRGWLRRRWWTRRRPSPRRHRGFIDRPVPSAGSYLPPRAYSVVVSPLPTSRPIRVCSRSDPSFQRRISPVSKSVCGARRMNTMRPSYLSPISGTWRTAPFEIGDRDLLVVVHWLSAPWLLLWVLLVSGFGGLNGMESSPSTSVRACSLWRAGRRCGRCTPAGSTPRQASGT